MSIPLDFAGPEDYLEQIVEFFLEYRYLFTYPNTDVLIHNIFDKIPIDDEVINRIDVFDKDFDLTSVNDEFLQIFLHKVKRFQLFFDDIREDVLDRSINVPLSPKKKHEIIYLTEEIKEMCEMVGCDVVVDFGSGLGYLDQHLFETTNYRILGIECNENHYVAAKIRQRKYHPTSTDNVKYIKHTITKDSHTNIQEYLQDKFEYHGEFCVTGLHACADLTIDAIDLFLKMDHAKAMVIMPCCYHKMAKAGNGLFFQNFPLPGKLAAIFFSSQGEKIMSAPFLRLAAQPPSVDDKLEDLVFNLLSRAVLQLYSFKNKCSLKRKKRKAVKTKNMENNFEVYLQDATTNGFTLTKNESSQNVDNVENPTFCLKELMALWNEMTQVTFKKAGIFILLQNYLQPVIENVVLYDRLDYLKCHGVKYCKLKRILNVKTSPRCIALVAHK